MANFLASLVCSPERDLPQFAECLKSALESFMDFSSDDRELSSSSGEESYQGEIEFEEIDSDNVHPVKRREILQMTSLSLKSFLQARNRPQ